MRVVRFLPCSFILLTLLCPAQSRRLDISRFGIVRLAPSEQLTVTVRATAPGNGCKVHLVYLLPTSASAQRSLSLNLAAGTSASDMLTAPANGDELLVRPAAWVDPSSKAHDCELSEQTGEKGSNSIRQIAPDDECASGTCKGITAEELKERTLRLYISALEGHPCRAELGFRFPNGRVSASSKYIALRPNHGDWLEWSPGLDDALAPGETVVPVVAFHKDDGCVVSAEALPLQSAGVARQIPVLAYASPVVGLAIDPASLPATVNALLSEVARNPDDLWAVNALARAYDRQGLREHAVELLTNATKANPNASETWYVLAQLEYEQHDFQASAQHLQRYLSLVPDDARGRAAYGDVLAKLDRFDEAQRVLLPLLNAPLTRTPVALDSEGEVLLGEGHYAAALASVDEAELKHPGCATNLHLKAEVLFALGRLAESAQTAERVIQIDPTDSTAHLLLAKLYSKQGKLHDAAVQTSWLHDNLAKAR